MGGKVSMGITTARLKKVLLAGALISMVFFVMGPQFAHATPQDSISSGEDALYSETISGILQAHSIFVNAKVTYPNDPVINAYLAMTRLLNLALTSNPGGLQELLSRYGIFRTGIDLDTLDYMLPKDANDKYNVPATAPKAESVRAFMAGALLSAIDASIGNLDTTIAGWNDAGKHIVAQEKRNSDSDLEIDLGDIYLFRAILKELKSLTLITSAYDLNVDLREMAALRNLEAISEGNFLNRHQDFLRLLPTTATPTDNGINKLALARTALVNAIDDYIAASQKIRNDVSLTPGAVELIEIDECDLLREAWYRTTLTSIKNSLSGASGPIAEISAVEEEWLFTDQATGNRIMVNLEDNKSSGEFYGIDGIFAGYWGDVECILINGSQISIEMESTGWQYIQITFTGTLNESNGTIIGNYNGWSTGGPLNGNFNGLRSYMESDNLRINLDTFFGNGSGPYDVRDFLPLINACDDFEPNTVGYGLNPSAPDATLGGIMPDFTQADWKLDPDNCLPAGTSSVSGTLSVPAYNGNGPIYIQIFRNFGQNIIDLDIRLGIQVIYPDEFTEGMVYSLGNLPSGYPVYIAAWWDKDFNGILTSDDLITYTASFTTQSNQTNLNLRLTGRYMGAIPWVHMLLSDN
jgi:hypothetical protein